MVAKTDARRVQRTQKQARIEPNASAKILSYLMVRINAFVIKDIIIQSHKLLRNQMSAECAAIRLMLLLRAFNHSAPRAASMKTVYQIIRNVSAPMASLWLITLACVLKATDSSPETPKDSQNVDCAQQTLINRTIHFIKIVLVVVETLNQLIIELLVSVETVHLTRLLAVKILVNKPFTKFTLLVKEYLDALGLKVISATVAVKLKMASSR